MQKIHGHDCRESHEIPPNTRSSKWVQIQPQPLSKRKIPAIFRMAKWTSWRSKSKIDFHADNIHARSHTAAASQKFMEENAMRKAPRLPYSRDLAHCDFYLFGYVKYCLRRQSFDTAGELFSASEVILMGIEKSTLDAVFLKSM